ncbi:MAG: hypothetical protein U0228_15335 [Myxococcaceae bacterium]
MRLVSILFALLAVPALAGAPSAREVDLRDQVGRARHVVIATAGKPVRCTGEPAKTCTQVTLTIEKTLKGQASGSITVRVDGLKVPPGRATWLFQGTARTQALPATAATVKQVEALVAQLCERPTQHARCADLGAFCELESTACQCSRPVMGIAVPKELVWQCEPRACFDAAPGLACDGGVQCQWLGCANGTWAAVPPPP